MSYRLYISRWCVFCQRVLMFLDKHQHSVDFADVSQVEHKQALVAGGGKGQVPCLLVNEDGNDTWLYESSDIIDYLKAQNFPKK